MTDRMSIKKKILDRFEEEFMYDDGSAIQTVSWTLEDVKQFISKVIDEVLEEERNELLRENKELRDEWARIVRDSDESEDWKQGAIMGASRITGSIKHILLGK